MAGGSPDTGGIDTDQENGARSQTEGGVGELEGAQSEGVDTISREQTVLKWGYEQGPAAVSSKYKDVLQATAANLDTRISQLREMLTNSQHQVANYEQNDEEIAASFRKAAGSETGVASAGGTTVPPVPHRRPRQPEPVSRGAGAPMAVRAALLRARADRVLKAVIWVRVEAASDLHVPS